MRKRTLLAGLVILCGGVISSPMAAQEAGFTVGLKSGAINTGVHSDLAAFLNTDWRTGYTGGAFAAIDLTPVVTVQLDLLYSKRGFGFRMYDEVVTLIPGEAKVRAIEGHLLLGFGLPWGERRWRPRLFAGPVFGLELSCEVEGSVLGMRFNEDCHDPTVGLDTHSRDSGLILGGALDMALNPLVVIVDGRYAHGLRNLHAGPGAGDDLKSRAWSFTVGVGWPF